MARWWQISRRDEARASGRRDSGPRGKRRGVGGRPDRQSSLLLMRGVLVVGPFGIGHWAVVCRSPSRGRGQVGSLSR